jgi:hypothetical protein
MGTPENLFDGTVQIGAIQTAPVKLFKERVVNFPDLPPGELRFEKGLGYGFIVLVIPFTSE